MSRRDVFFDFDDAWIVHHDASLIAVDKPEGVPTQAADPDRPDDLVTRLRRYLAAKTGEREPYLGTHQRLDRDTSGVIVFTRDRSVNAAVAAQFEGRKVEKRYLAAVAHWPAKRDKVTLDDWLAPGDDGRMAVVREGRRGAQRARTHVRVVSRKGDRTLLALELETGRTHQARVQLAHAKAPIAGDVLYGGPVAPRLLLHASALVMKHPRTNEKLVLETRSPEDLREWIDAGDRGTQIYEDPVALRRALRRAVLRRYGLGRSEGARTTEAFRVVNEEGDALPKLAVDVYGDHAIVQFYGDDGPWASAALRDRVLDEVYALGFRGVYAKVRPKQANTLVDTRREEIAPKLAVRGESAPEEITVLEEGVPYLVRLGDGLSTGIFLDQRANRMRVRELAQGKSLLNLFAYTAGFSLAAALHGAKRTVSVDAAPVILERARAGFLNAKIDLAAHAFVAEDAFTYLARAAHKRERFDVIVLDPPSYSSTKKGGRFVADSDYGELASAALAVLAPGGRMLACTNHRGIRKDRFRRILFDAARRAGRNAKQVKDLPDPHDFPPPPGGESHLKSVLVTLE